MTARQEQSRVLLVLGMHRSGTSAATRVVNLLGANLGDKLVEPGPDNPDGFWEHAEAVRINDALLEGLGRTWYDMREMPQDWQDTEAAGQALAQIQMLIRQDFRPGPLWAIKDPRMCLTVPIWIRALRGLGYAVDCLFVIRNPREVVDSLHVRNNWVRGPLYLMWVQYLMEAEAASRHERRALITYDELLADWRGAMQRVAIELEIAWPVTLEMASAEVGAFLNKGRRHHVTDPEDAVDADDEMPELAGKLYQACLAISRGEKTWAAISRLEKTYRSVAGLYAEHVDQLIKLRWQAEARAQVAEASAAAPLATHEATLSTVNYERLAEGFSKSISGSHDLLARKIGTIVSAMAGGMDHLGQGFTALQKELRENVHKDEEQEVAREARMGALESIFYDLSKRATATEVQFATIAGEMKARVEQQQSALAELGTTCGSFASQIDTLRTDTQGHTRALGESLERVSLQVEQRLAALDTELKAHVRSVAESGASAVGRVEQRLTALGAALKTGEQSMAESGASTMHRIEDVAGELRSRLDDMQHAHDKRDMQVERFLTELGSREALIHQLKSSTSWRITAPLRLLRKALTLRTWKVMLGRGVKSSYEKLPLPMHRRLALKGKVFRALAPLIRNTRSYRAWQAFEAHRGFDGAATVLCDSPVISLSPSLQSQQDSSSVDVVEPPSLAGHVLNELNAAASKVANEYVTMDDRPADLSRIDVRAIAFYLPQFHPIPENDAWWGRGFTEWTNVSKAVPQFVGHYQPRLPGELGYYDLRLVDVMRRQVELARRYGLQGFCFHYYWFGGRRLLEKPLQQFLDNKDIDFPFCICWANENWSRRWDGMDQDILIGQNHSPEDDIAFVTALEPLLRDPRYIRVDGKPLIVLYRPSLLPDAKATQQRWREHCRKTGVGEIVLAMVQFDVEDPRTFGFDVAIEFPPHKLARGLEPINDKLQIVNSEYSGYVIEYDNVIERAREHEAPGFDMIRGVFPSWDNEARKPGKGYTFANATPARYRVWLDLAIDYARQHPVVGESLVFINAWNEWAEGAYLEPDRRYGYAYLDQTRQALLAKPGAHLLAQQRHVAIVSHDAHPHGAQYLALNLARELKNGLGMQVDVLLMGGGQLAASFAEVAQVHDLSAVSASELDSLLVRLRQSGVELVIANTAVSGRITRAIAATGVHVITLVHELPKLIRDYGLESAIRDLVTYSDKVVLPSEAVVDGLEGFVDSDMLANKSVLRPQGLFTRSKYRGETDLAGARASLREKLGLPGEARIVLAVGYADRRKGVDLLLGAAAICCKADPFVHFVWVGHTDVSLERESAATLAKGGMTSRFHFVGMDFQTDDYYAGADLYALASREDPFPSVVLESLSVGTPVVAFVGAGGGSDLLARGGGVVVPAFDVEKYAGAIMSLLDDDAERSRLGEMGKRIVDAEFSFRSYVLDLLQYGGMRIPRVSVVVPNFNYAHYLPERLASITAQTVPIYEIIFLDDGSSDDSLEIMQRLRQTTHPEPRIVVNHANSGSVFRQWQRGVQLARGDFVWIAEADDLAKPDFLERLLEGMLNDPDVVLGYCESEAIDEHGMQVMTDYRSYTNDLSMDRWSHPYVADGAAEVDAALAIKNTIPNVSAVLFRRQPLLDVMNEKLEEIARYKVAGDWVVYLHLLRAGKIFYAATVCNCHRRHSGSVTQGIAAEMHYREVVELQESARSMYPLSAQAVKFAAAYRQKLRNHLNVTDTRQGGE